MPFSPPVTGTHAQWSMPARRVPVPASCAAHAPHYLWWAIFGSFKHHLTILLSTLCLICPARYCPFIISTRTHSLGPSFWFLFPPVRGSTSSHCQSHIATPLEGQRRRPSVISCRSPHCKSVVDRCARVCLAASASANASAPLEFEINQSITQSINTGTTA